MTEPLPMLKGCPFCGAAPSSRWWGCGYGGESDDGYWGIDCPNTCAQAHEDDEETAVAKWNTRLASRDPEAAKLEEMREALTKCRDRFREYERQHRDKAERLGDTIEREDRDRKADRNQEMAEMCDAALTGAKP